MAGAFKRVCAAALWLMCVAGSAYAQEPSIRNGAWWQKLPGQEVKWGYLVGFFDGMGLGHRLSWWPLEASDQTSDCVPKVVDAYRAQVRQYLATLDSQKLALELDGFYREPKNRSIRVADAVWIVANQLAGRPKAEVDALIEDYRSR